MKKKIIILIIIIFILILLLGLFFLLLNSKVKEFEIVQKTNGGVPYNWEYKIKNNDLIEFKKLIVDENKNDIVGGKITKHYVFKALKEGTTTITFKYVGLDKTVIERKVYDIVIDKNLKVIINEHDKDTHFEIIQTKNTHVNYKWEIKIEDKSIVKLEEVKQETSKELGDDIIDIKYKFNSLKEGETFITFEYFSDDTKEIMETKKYKVIIDNNMNISVLEE